MVKGTNVYYSLANPQKYWKNDGEKSFIDNVFDQNFLKRLFIWHFSQIFDKSCEQAELKGRREPSYGTNWLKYNPNEMNEKTSQTLFLKN